MLFLFLSDVIWVILPVDEGGLLGLTQQLSSLGQGLSSPFTESLAASPQANPFSPSTPVHQSPQHNYKVPQNSPASDFHNSPIRRSLFGVQVRFKNCMCMYSGFVKVLGPVFQSPLK